MAVIKKTTNVDKDFEYFHVSWPFILSFSGQSDMFYQHPFIDWDVRVHFVFSFWGLLLCFGDQKFIVCLASQDFAFLWIVSSLVIVSYAVQKLHNFMQFHLSILDVIFWAVRAFSKKSLSMLAYLMMFLRIISDTFTVLGL